MSAHCNQECHIVHTSLRLTGEIGNRFFRIVVNLLAEPEQALLFFRGEFEEVANNPFYHGILEAVECNQRVRIQRIRQVFRQVVSDVFCK